jgi:patatin-like phospholipase/acyl hydrolase
MSGHRKSNIFDIGSSNQVLRCNGLTFASALSIKLINVVTPWQTLHDLQGKCEAGARGTCFKLPVEK